MAINIYKQASKSKLRIQTEKGLLTVDQLWDLSKQELDSLAVAAENEYNGSGAKTFLNTKSAKDKKLKLKLDILLDILRDKIKEDDKIRQNLEKTTHNRRIDELIARKKNEELEEMSIEELEKLRK